MAQTFTLHLADLTLHQTPLLSFAPPSTNSHPLTALPSSPRSATPNPTAACNSTLQTSTCTKYLTTSLLPHFSV
ncbi:hypothetical protein IQ06DRAFT_298406 [Phaeosphaeriaceae sp. SRC1lsM3a]|nr:hypothetical protein IQ06DRAFT_298406 [Stagonospora sp. SRC1lsM3a]